MPPAAIPRRADGELIGKVPGGLFWAHAEREMGVRVLRQLVDLTSMSFRGSAVVLRALRDDLDRLKSGDVAWLPVEL